MAAFFLDLLKVSLSAGVLIFGIICLRYVLKQTAVPKWLICALWALVAVKLICPVLPEASFSLTPRWETVDDWADDYCGSTQLMFPEAEGYQAAIDAGIKPYGPDRYVVTGADGVSEPPTVATEWVPILAYIWLGGMAVIALWTLFSWLRLRRQVAASFEEDRGVYLCDHLQSPFILGLVFPKIYLPSDLTVRTRAAVLSHEEAHLRRHDHWWKALGFLLLTIHWFNPLMWVAYVLMCRDIEAACDEKVVKGLNLEDRKSYAQALLDLSLPRRQISACPLAFGEVNVKERVVNVLNYKKATAFVLAAALLGGLLLAGCFLTTAPDAPHMTPLEEAAHTYSPEQAEAEGCLVQQDWIPANSGLDRLNRFMVEESDTLRVANFKTDEEGCQVYEVVRVKDGFTLRYPGKEDRTYAYLRKENWIQSIPSGGGIPSVGSVSTNTSYFLCDREDVRYLDCVMSQSDTQTGRGIPYFTILTRFNG